MVIVAEPVPHAEQLAVRTSSHAEVEIANDSERRPFMIPVSFSIAQSVLFQAACSIMIEHRACHILDDNESFMDNAFRVSSYQVIMGKRRRSAPPTSILEAGL